ncbi:MAG: SHOCT domain-containing protein [Betaproteobacteria bacterium]
MMWRYWNWADGYWGAGWHLAMLVGMVLWWGLVIAAVVLFVRWLIRQEREARLAAGGRSAAQDPLTIVKLRYARGEITREQYEELKETLQR